MQLAETTEEKVDARIGIGVEHNAEGNYVATRTEFERVLATEGISPGQM
ncbi:MAG: hypothetical protein GW893_12750 [Armatimonadetes bacterium]|nr:hypothetical protein [Armatimonadota bacterium]